MQATSNRALPVGYKLQDYTIQKVLSAGGFSFVYLARDAEGEIVAVKEYLPTALALRTEGERVEATTESLGSFRYGLKCFFEEGRALATIDHKNIVRVLNFFRANNTVYMVMQYERGQSLQDLILGRAEPLSEHFVRLVFSELLNGLREVHSQKLLHLDIKPANIYIRQDRTPVLLDFGSARQTLSKVQPELPPCYTPGFAAPEQHTDHTLLGPWSDVYSVGTSMYACLVRAAPMSAEHRVKKDRLLPAKKIGKGIYSESLLEIIDNCMALNHMERPQSVFSLQKSLIENIPQAEKDPSLLASLKNYLKK
jgi:serine/threonine protein kinase